jgi:hypothetical protein
MYARSPCSPPTRANSSLLEDDCPWKEANMSITNHHSEYATDVLKRLDDAVEDAAEMSLLSLAADELNTWLVSATELVARAQALQFTAIQEAETAGLSARFGSRLLTTHLAKETNGSATSLGADGSLAIWLNNFPELHAAMLAGALTRPHLNELRNIDKPRTHMLLQRDETMLVEAAKDFDWVAWKKIVAYWLNAADPDGKLTDPTDPKYGMTVTTRANGDVAVGILMDPVTGEAFLTMHEPEVEKLSEAEREDPNSAPMSLRHKNLTAFMKILIRGWRRENGSEPTPLINIVMSEKVAEDLLARAFGHESPDGESPLDIDPFELPIAWDQIDGRCETIRGTPISPKHALGLLLIGKLRRTVMSAPDRVIDLGKDARFFNQTQRNALLVQSRGQCVDGCQAPFSWLQADHIRPKSKHGLTDLNNGAMRCRPDNQAKGNSLGWT